MDTHPRHERPREFQLALRLFIPHARTSASNGVERLMRLAAGAAATRRRALEHEDRTREGQWLRRWVCTGTGIRHINRSAVLRGGVQNTAWWAGPDPSHRPELVQFPYSARFRDGCGDILSTRSKFGRGVPKVGRLCAHVAPGAVKLVPELAEPAPSFMPLPTRAMSAGCGLLFGAIRGASAECGPCGHNWPASPKGLAPGRSWPNAAYTLTVRFRHLERTICVDRWHTPACAALRHRMHAEQIVDTPKTCSLPADHFQCPCPTITSQGGGGGVFGHTESASGA